MDIAAGPPAAHKTGEPFRSLTCVAGQEHGQTIPLADIEPLDDGQDAQNPFDLRVRFENR